MKRGIDYIGVGVGAIIINDEGKYLLAKRGKKAKNYPSSLSRLLHNISAAYVR